MFMAACGGCGTSSPAINDLPPEFRVNVNTGEVPYNRRLGDAPALSDTEIEDVIAFLRTLSDGYTP
ncbi:MAG TPA: hypothetical protein VII31_06015 [Caldimonas sp.]